jgi:hypothetical protein
MQAAEEPRFHDKRRVLRLRFGPNLSVVKTESTPKCRACGLASSISSYRPLNWRNGSEILKPLVREHRAHTAFMSVGLPAMHEVQYLRIGVAVVTRP